MDEMITWESLKSAANECKEYQELRDAVTSGFPWDKDSWPETMRKFKAVHKELTVLDDLVMLHKRVPVPVKLRSCVWRHLHACHSGVGGMTQHARDVLARLYNRHYQNKGAV